MKKNLQLEGTKILYHKDRVNAWFNGEDIAPLYLEIGPSRVCNQRCVHCYIGHFGFDGTNLEEDIFIKLIEDSAKIGVKGIQYAGCGESLTNKSLTKAVSLGKKLGIQQALTTNGVLYIKKKIEETLENITWVRYSVLGFNEKDYGKLHRCNPKQYQVFRNNLYEAALFKSKNNLDTTLGLVMYVFEDNVSSIYQFVKNIKDVGLDYVQIKCAAGNYHNNENYFGDAMNRRSELLTKFKDELAMSEKLSDDNFKCIVRWEQFNYGSIESKGIEAFDLPGGCMSLAFQCAIDSDGKVYTCNGHWQDQDFCYGDLHEKSFIDIWYSDRRRSINNSCARKINYKECYYPCRHLASNKVLWDLSNEPNPIQAAKTATEVAETNPPKHINLI
jgi:radical SAM protein with 4Fe4S-binding SPASM domain